MNGVRKLYISLLSLLLGVVMFGTATYAWITLTAVANVDGFALSASTGDELQISLDGVSYFSKLSGNLVMERLKDLRLIDVTSSDGETFFYGGNRTPGRAIENKDYISLTIWFRTTDAHRSIYLADNVSSQVEYDTDMEGTYVVSRGILWKATYTFMNGPNEGDVVNKGDENTYYAADAVRMAFIERKNLANPNDTREENELKRFIFDPSENPERGFGTSYGALDYFFRKTERQLIAPAKPETRYELTQFSPSNPYMPLSDDSKVLDLIATDQVDSRGRTIYVGILTINIWLEGWDADCFDAIFRDRIKIQLKFKAGTPNPSWMENLNN